MKIGEFANRTGVTVKTLLHYDKLGLLSPTQRSEVGHRIYSDEEFLKLQQITTLKYVGLSLKAIKEMLNKKGSDVGSMIKIQKDALLEKKKHLDALMAVLNQAEEQLKSSEPIGVEQLVEIIKVTTIKTQVQDQYKTIDNLSDRSNLHSYNINRVDWTEWCFNQMNLPSNARILEIGCGTGDLWLKNKDKIEDEWSITLSDYSNGMLIKAKEKLDDLDHKFTYKYVDVQNIPYKDNSYDVVIARHMLYVVPDIEKAINELQRILVSGGILYLTTNSRASMFELNELMDKFDGKLRLSNNGMCERFNSENGLTLLKMYFDDVKTYELSGQIVVDQAEPVVSYKASTIKGRTVLVGEKKLEFKRYIEKYIKEHGALSITTKACMFEAVKY